MKNFKLYKVTLRGMTCGDRTYGISYAVAENSDQAYQKVRKYLDEKDLGFTKNRELDKVELIADTNQYGDCGVILYT